MEKIKNIKLPNGEVYELGGSGLDGKVTNCITEIPQRIKVELDNGTLTLKAGSEVIVPNGKNADGSLKFDYVTVENDYSWASSTTAGTRFGFFTGGSFLGNVNTYMYSGNTATMNSTSAFTYGCFYNTETNKIYTGNSNGGSWVEKTGWSLPFCIFVNDTTGKVTSLNQVFNGIGYIGSTVWVDKGVKGLISNGRNEDGTCKNVEFTVPKIYLRHADSSTHKYKDFAIAKTGIGISTHTLDNKENYLYNASGVRNTDRFVAGNIQASSTAPYQITSLQPKQAFRAVDYSELTPTIPDYSAMVQSNGTGWIQVAKDSFVMSYGVDAYAEDYWVQVSPNQSTVYNVGRRADDQNQYTQHVSFTFFVPAKWYFRTTAENAYAYIYPLKGAK